MKNYKNKFKSLICIMLCVLLCGCSSVNQNVILVTDSNGSTYVSFVPPKEQSSDSHSSIGSDNSQNGGSNPNTNPQNPIDKGKLSESANQYEGVEGTGKFNYGEALQKSFIFYELQRSGKLNGDERTNWRGDSALNDGKDNGVDLTGGLYDAGDNVKFNLPMAYTSTMLAWSVIEDLESYNKSGQLKYALSTIKYIDDYLIKCHTSENEYYYQVGDGNADHAWWGAAEVMQMNRPSYKVDNANPGSTVAGEAAAALAAACAAFKNVDKEYSELCLSHAKQLFKFAEDTKSDSGYTAANGFYNSWSGFYDELCWAAGWLYTATNDKSYLEKAKDYFSQLELNHKWSHCWDDKGIGCALRLSQITKDSTYSSFLEQSLDFWSATGSEKITVTPKGLSWLDQWGSLRYATTMAFIAASYSQSKACPAAKKQVYWDWAVSQVDYALGSTGRSFVCGFGENYPKNPHHRTAQGSYCDNKNIPEQARHTLYGALVGGPDASDGYRDSVEDYTVNEVACDYNVGYTCALAKLYGKYGGKTLVNFGAVEPVETEYEVEACVNAQGDSFVEIKAIVYNKTAWPARVGGNLKLRYFIDLSETSYSSASVNMGYSKDNATVSIVPWDEENNIYCAEVDFGNTLIYPGGQDACRSEVQFRMTASAWNNDNDFSYQGLGSTQGTVQPVTSIALYDNDKLIYGTQPDGQAGQLPSNTNSNNQQPSSSQSSQNLQPNQPQNPPSSAAASASEGGITLTLNSSNGQQNAITLNMELANISGKDIALGGLELRYYFTKDGGSPVFECYYSAIEGDNYQALSGVKGTITDASGKDTDSVAIITFGNGTLSANAKITLNAVIHNSDWSNINQSNDFSYQNAGNIAVYSAGKKICGKEP